MAHHRLPAALVAAVVTASLGVPTVLPAVAAASAHAPAPRNNSSTNPVEFLIQTLQLTAGEVLTPANLQAILADFPGFPPYGSLG